MVTSLKKINSFVADTVDQAVFLRDAPRPTTCEQMSERLRLPRALKWITHYRFDQIQHSDCGAPVGLDPISQVLTELRMEHSSYWGFVGNRYSHWNTFFPLMKWQRQEIVEVVKVDVLQTQVHGRIQTGHNSLAALIYFFTFLAFVAQTVTGFALYSSMSNSWLPQMFNWVVPILGGDEGVRYWHHLFLWFFVSFIIIHVYLAFYHDYIEGRGTISSIVGGWKFEREKSDKDKSEE